MFANLFFIGLYCFAGTAVGSNARTAVLCDGTTLTAVISTIDRAGEITLATGKKTRVVPTAELVRWGSPANIATDRPSIVLADGAILVADIVSSGRDHLTVDSTLAGKIVLPWSTVAAVVLHPSSDSLLDRAAQGSGDIDRLLLLNDDEVTGSLKTIDGEKIHMQTELGLVDVEIERVTAIILRSPSSKSPEVRLWAGLCDGSRLPASSIVFDAKSLAITLESGVILHTQPGNLVWLQPVGSRAVYLSDLKPTDYRHVPFLSLAWPYRLDRSVRDRWLRCGQQSYFKGLGMHSAARLSYFLSEPYRRFEADVGIDDETAGGGSVRFHVLVDGQEKYTSPIVRGGQKPLPVRVDLTGVKRIDLVVDYADRADELDHADWLDARLIR